MDGIYFVGNGTQGLVHAGSPSTTELHTCPDPGWAGILAFCLAILCLL